MFTTGSKFLLGATVVTILGAVFYGVAVGGALGTITLVSAAFGLFILAVVNIAVRDSNISALDQDAFASAPAAQTSARPSIWPLLAAVGVVVVALGLVTNSVTFVLGMGLFVAAGFEWIIQGWSERASDDARFNEEAREQFAHPLELPVGGAIVAGVVVFMFSRVMLGLPDKSATVAAFGVVAAIVLLVGAVIGTNRSVSKPAMVGSFAIGLVAVAAAGTVYGLNGPREIEVHETTADLAEEDHCVADETHADENASQTVAAKSNVNAVLTFDGTSLHADVPGFDGEFDQLTFMRANPSNVIFRNESGEEARLEIDLHPGEDTDYPERACTALVEDGAAQFLTLYFSRSTRIVEDEGGDGFAFVVPGSDAAVEVIVP